MGIQSHMLIKPTTITNESNALNFKQCMSFAKYVRSAQYMLLRLIWIIGYIMPLSVRQFVCFVLLLFAIRCEHKRIRIDSFTNTGGRGREMALELLTKKQSHKKTIPLPFRVGWRQEKNKNNEYFDMLWVTTVNSIPKTCKLQNMLELQWAEMVCHTD